MIQLLSRFKLQASCSTHLFFAASIWTVVGVGLMFRGTVWLSGAGQLWLVFPSLLFGFMKSFFMLDKSALVNIARIISTREGKCICSVYSVETWLMVLLMMATGCLLRHSSLPQAFLGFFYVSIGWGLLLSSRHVWKAWQARVRPSLKHRKNI